jgi:hypothetical protein
VSNATLIFLLFLPFCFNCFSDKSNNTSKENPASAYGPFDEFFDRLYIEQVAISSVVQTNYQNRGPILANHKLD